MLGNMVFLLFISIEIGMIVVSILKKSNVKRGKSILSIVLFSIFLLLVISPIIDWGLNWMMLGILLGVQALLGLVTLLRHIGNKPLKKSKMILGFLGRVILYALAIFPLLLFPPYEPIKTTGENSVSTKSFTWTDQSRKELFTEEADDNRKVTVQFWYPSKQADKKFPLVVFSHGAFGLRTSNYSTYQELASNGYVVASIDHTFHAFLTEQVDGKRVITNMDFMNDAIKATNGEIQGKELFVMEQAWMKLRTEDMTFVIDKIKKMTGSETENIFQLIDLERIGVMGHSLGGATAAKIGRIDETVDAVIVLDGTMLGEVIGFMNGKELLTDEPYPKPILNFYNESHYEDETKGNPDYPNNAVHKNSNHSYQVIIRNSEHMNFTDLPIVSPILSNLLGTGAVDARECIETTNEVILQFFDRYLKDNPIEFEKERVLKL
ncbi:alpha/beta hydrolase family protein [Niallia oryzisoli]|uniref:alpha/beta hydrolase family protein n=1 Tax=Niallia oryzisoli TaxID=1737571 RepID=UPI003736D2B0